MCFQFFHLQLKTVLVSPSCPWSASSLRLRRGADLYACGRWCACAAREPEDCAGGGCRGMPEFRSAGECSSESPCGDRLRRGLPFQFPGGDGSLRLRSGREFSCRNRRLLFPRASSHALVRFHRSKLIRSKGASAAEDLHLRYVPCFYFSSKLRV